MTSADFSSILPEFLLAVYALGALVFGVSFGKDKVARALVWATVVVLVVFATWIGFGKPGAPTAFGGMFVDDAYARFCKGLMLFASAGVLAISVDYMDRRNLLHFEFPVLLVLALIGMMMMVSAGDLMALYVGLELMSLALYVVAALRRESPKSSEAGLKYFVLGSLASGILLYGASLTYGFAGTTSFAGIIQVVQGDGRLPVGLLFGMVFMLAGLAFKISAVPFHMWTPDVYEGAPTPVTSFFATAPKVAAMALIARLMFDAFGHVSKDWTQVIAVIAVLSMFFGAIGGVAQRNIKRLMAYSSITHMGFAMLGLLGGNAYGVQAMLFYMSVYVVMNIGTFAFVMSMERNGQPITDIAAMNLFAPQQPLKAVALMILFFSLAGVPPTLGYFGKFTVLKGAIEGGYTWAAALGVMCSIIAAFYYLRIVYLMYFGKEGDPLDTRMPMAQWVVMMGCVIIVLLGVFNVLGLDTGTQAAAAALVR